MPASNHPELRHLRSGSLSIPSAHNLRGNGALNNSGSNNNHPHHHNGNGNSNGNSNGGGGGGGGSSSSNNNNNNMAGQQRFDGPRSPPNTSHVPCKFFRQGTCQAGNACPFSHDLNNATENVCKYFSKGNCKFGPKCANIHMLPDGRRINYGKNGVTIAPAPISLGSRVNPPTYPHPSNSALTSSFMRSGDAYSGAGHYLATEDMYGGHQLGRQPSMENGVPTIDTTYSSNPASVYGSPREDDLGRFGMGLSPATFKGLSVLDAPLPASFDSNGISHAARYGPWPSSMPSKFGFDSPSASLNAHKDSRTSETLKLLHTSAFGSSDHLAAAASQDMASSSPPVHGSDEYLGRRTLHSASRFTKPRVLSASVPKGDRDDWDPEFMFLEEDYIPSTLANDVLTPQEKARRGSVRLTDDPSTSSGVIGNGGEPSPSSFPKFGSLSASPSRWGPLFQRQRAEEDGDHNHGHRMIPGKSMKNVASVFGHVGSPLRNSSLAIDAELDRAADSNGSPRHRPRTESLSALTQQLQSANIGDHQHGGSGPRLHPNSARGSTGLGSSSLLGGKDGDLDPRGLTQRNVSSGSVSSSGKFATPIDEEDSAFVFSMEEEDDVAAAQNNNQSNKKRASGSIGVGVWGSYAGVSTGSARNGVSSDNKGRDGLGVGGR